MNKLKDGGPAFPTEGPSQGQFDSTGMTLRDYFAAKAMQSYAAFVMSADVRFSAAYDEIALEAYRMADAMLAARGAA